MIGKSIAVLLSSMAWGLVGCTSNPYKELEMVAKTCDNSDLKGYIHQDETLHVEIECKEGKGDVPR